MAYFDTTFIIRLYVDQPGYVEVRQLAATGSEPVASASIGRSETMAALHRKLREGNLGTNDYQQLLNRLFADEKIGAFLWHPLTNAVMRRLEKVWPALPASVYLRSAEAIHLATAAENQHHVVYSNDRHFLAAAPAFGLTGRNPITP